MRVVHVTGYYSEKMAYQENLLPLGQYELGHDVVIITGRYEPDFGFNSLTRKRPKGWFVDRGVKILRLNHYFELKNKGPVLFGLIYNLYKLKPELLFVHGIGSAFLVCLIYKLIFSKVILQFDCHSTKDNSLGSKIGPFYHGIFRFLFSLSKHKFDRIFGVSPESIQFMEDVYKLNPSYTTLLPLPGDASLINKYSEIRGKVRSDWQVDSDALILIHTGKLPGDKETEMLLKVFLGMENRNLKLMIAGSIDKSFEIKFDEYLSQDARIKYLGWVDAHKLREYFIASDLLVQPGSLSNSFVDAICCGLPVLLGDTPQGRYLTKNENGKVVSRNDYLCLRSAIVDSLNRETLINFKRNSLNAAEMFSYQTNAKLSIAHLDCGS
tara:strand:+ start:24868 stop:26010 length:1143 start_codon:yes stop_codon:yes gene_type:complete